MEHKVEIWNRGDMAVEIHDGQQDYILNPGERVTFNASNGLGIGPVVMRGVEADDEPAPTEGQLAFTQTTGEGSAPVDPVDPVDPGFREE